MKFPGWTGPNGRAGPAIRTAATENGFCYNFRRRYRLEVRTLDSQSRNRGSIPRTATNLFSFVPEFNPLEC